MKKISQCILALLTTLMLAACGGGGEVTRDGSNSGGDSGNGGSDPVVTYSISLELADASGNPSSNLTSDTPLTLTATVTDQNGDVANNQLITFSLSNNGLAVFPDSSAGTALTNSDGVATIDLEVGEVSGSGMITASLASGETAQIGFNSSGMPAPPFSIALSFIDSVGTGSTELSVDNSLILTAVLTNDEGEAQSNTVINFDLSNSGLATFSNDTGTATTNSAGVAMITLSVGELSGSGTVTASIESGQSAQISFSSTGLPEFDYAIALNLSDASGAESTQLAIDNSLILTATVTSESGAPIANQVVSFDISSDDLASFSNQSGTALTNGEGIAVITLNVGASSGSGFVSASIESGEAAQIGFMSEGIPEFNYTLALSLTDNTGAESNQLSGNNPLTLTAVVTDSYGEPLANSVVEFSFSAEGLAEFSNSAGTALTNTDGVATITILVGELSGSATVIATIESGEIAQIGFTSTGITSSNRQPAEISLYASALQLASSGSDEIELIALVKDANSVLLENVDVTFSVSSNAEVELQLVQATTAEDGTARAILTSQNNAGNRSFEVSAQAGGFSDVVEIEVDGTEVVINGPSSLVLNDTADYTLRIQDSDGNAISNQEITLITTGGSLSSNTVTTENGQASVTYTATQSGSVTITAQVPQLNTETSISVTVQEDEFVFIDTVTPVESQICNAHDEREFENIPECEINVATDITVNWQKDGLPNTAANVTFSASRGEISSNTTVATDSEGNATFTITSNNAGRSSITATGFDENGNVEVTARMEIEFIATVPYVIQVDASPDILGPDGQTSTITALVRDQDRNLVKNAVITFNVNDSSTGTLSPSQATTDSNGIASTVFTSGAVNSLEAIVITAKSLEDENVSGDVTMTVGNRAFDISMGTGNVISSPDNSTYLKEFAVFVSDSAGQPVPNVDLTASLSPLRYAEEYAYRKGRWFWDEDSSLWFVGYSYKNDDGNTEIRSGFTEYCINEDINNDGILDLLPVDGDTGVQGEDDDGDGYLTPGIIGTLTFSGDAVTDENGQATLELRYPKEYGMFYTGVLTVYGQSTGSEARTSTIYRYSVAGIDISDETVQPPNSPWGVGTPYGATHEDYEGTTSNCTVADDY